MKNITCCCQKLLLSATIVIAAFTISDAQTTGTSSNTSSSPNNGPVMSDTSFITKNIRDNMMEVRLSRLGRQKASDPQIKSMAQQMVTDHTQILNDLKRVARQKKMSEISDQSNGMANTGSGTSGSEVNSTIGSGTGTSGTGSTTGGGTGTSGTGSTTTGGGTGTSGTGSTTVSGTGTGATTGGGTGTGASAGSGAGTSGTDSTMGSATGNAVGMNQNMQDMNGMNHDMQNMQGMNGMDMAGMQALQNATGREFNTLFISQMLQMHEAKLGELQAALPRITDPILKSAVTKALPKIRMHRDMLMKMSNRTNSNGQ